jgi:MFS family permease
MPAVVKKHYEKVIVGCCLLVLFVNVGIPSTSFSVYQPYINALPGIGDSGGAFMLSIRTLVSLTCMLFVNRYYELFTCRNGVLISSLLVFFGFIAYSFGETLVILCLGAFLAGAGYGMGGMVATTMLIGRWYRGKQAQIGTALGIVAVGSGLTTLVIPPAVALLVESVGLAWTFRAEAFLALALAIVTFVFLRDEPGDMADREDLPESKHAKRTIEEEAAMRPLPRRRMLMLILAMIFMGCVAVGGTNYFSVLLTGYGMTAKEAALYVSVLGACLTVSMLVNGFILDKLGTRKGSLIFFALIIVGLIACCTMGFEIHTLATVGSVLFGAGVALGTVGVSSWSIEFAVGMERTRVIRNFQLARSTGGFLFNFAPMFLVGSSGSYFGCYVVLLAMAAACAFIVMDTYHRYRKPKAERRKAADDARVAPKGEESLEAHKAQEVKLKREVMAAREAMTSDAATEAKA